MIDFILSFYFASLFGSSFQSVAKATSFEMNGKDFKIITFTDIHFGNSNQILSIIQNMLDQHHPDFVIFTGDQGNDQTNISQHLDELAKIFTQNKVKWTAIFGNHDRKETYSSVDLLWESNRFESYDDYCLYTAGPLKWDNIDGNGTRGIYEKYGNYIIDITDGGKLIYELVFLDSGPYTGDYASDNGYLEKYQVDWYTSAMMQAAATTGRVIPSIVFMHMPLLQAADAEEMALGVGNTGDIPPQYGWGTVEQTSRGITQGMDTGMFDAVRKVGGTHICYGHIHDDNSDVTYQGIELVYLTKTGNNNYSSDPRRAEFATQIVIQAETHTPTLAFAMQDGSVTQDCNAWKNL